MSWSCRTSSPFLIMSFLRHAVDSKCSRAASKRAYGNKKEMKMTTTTTTTTTTKKKKKRRDGGGKEQDEQQRQEQEPPHTNAVRNALIPHPEQQ